jgi:hypothetical protein
VYGRAGTKKYATSTGDPPILAHFIRPRMSEGQAHCVEIDAPKLRYMVANMSTRPRSTLTLSTMLSSWPPRPMKPSREALPRSS